MRHEDLTDQAERFLAWHEKRGGELAEDFEIWATSKDFGPEDRMAIRTTAQGMLTGELEPPPPAQAA